MTLSKMLNEDIFDLNYAKNIAYTDLENSFNVTMDDDGFYKFNLNSTIVIDADNGNILYYKLATDMAWPLISYKIYGDTREAWILMKLNNVKFNDVFTPVKAGRIVKYLDTTLLQQIANIMSNL